MDADNSLSGSIMPVATGIQVEGQGMDPGLRRGDGIGLDFQVVESGGLGGFCAWWR